MNFMTFDIRELRLIEVMRTCGLCITVPGSPDAGPTRLFLWRFPGLTRRATGASISSSLREQLAALNEPPIELCYRLLP